MPILHAHVIAGYPAEKKAALLKTATQAVVDSLSAPLRSVRITLHEVPREHVIVAGEIGKDAVLFHVHLIAGRTEAQKSALFVALNQAARQSLGVSGEDVRVLVDDVPSTDLGGANGVSAKAAGR